MNIPMQKNSIENEIVSFGINFNDTKEHYNNAILRLMQIEEGVLNSFFSSPLNFSYSDKNFTLTEASQALQKNWTDTLRLFDRDNSDLQQVNIELDSCFGKINFDKLVKLVRNPNYTIALNSAIGFGVLVNTSDHSRVKNFETNYESEYFEGDLDGVGYGDLKNQSWRIEKAKRLVKELRSILLQIGCKIPLESMNVLDVGAGYGQFLNELKKTGSKVSGLDISEHAARTAKNRFEISIHQQTIDEFSKVSDEEFHLITMWDYIEHPDDPLIDLQHCYEILCEGGYLVIKTPNVLALEFDVFGGYYHSLKQEHLNYFSPNSLTQLLNMAGFELKIKYGISHIFQGLLSGSLTGLAIANGKESDIVLIAQKKSTP